MEKKLERTMKRKMDMVDMEMVTNDMKMDRKMVTPSEFQSGWGDSPSFAE